MSLPALAATLTLSAYLNAKYHLAKDLAHLYYAHRGTRHQAHLARQNDLNVWATFAANALAHPDRECIWFFDDSCTEPRTYTWKQAHHYARQWSQFFLQRGVRPGDCVGFYLQNSPELVLAWMGLLAIGCWPAMINYQLVGEALGHCVRVAGCGVLLVDGELVGRVGGGDEMGVEVVVVDGGLREEVEGLKGRLPEGLGEGASGEGVRLALRYTRLVGLRRQCNACADLSR